MGRPLTSASAAAYAVRAGMVCAVLVPQGKIALGKLSQALAHGARLLAALTGDASLGDAADDLVAALAATDATLAFDAVGGGGRHARRPARLVRRAAQRLARRGGKTHEARRVPRVRQVQRRWRRPHPRGCRR